METTLIIFFSSLFTILFFVVGGIVGWMANRHFLETAPTFMHPECLDENGNLLPDEILAVRFENDYGTDEDFDNN